MKTKSPLPTFTVGDKVVWTSQANGGETTKHGEIAYIVPAGERLDDHHWCDALVRRYGWYIRWRAVDGGATARDHESYLVVVLKSGTKWVHQTYHPRVAALRLEA